MVQRIAAACLLAALAAAVPSGAQPAPAPQRPEYRSGVDVVLVELTVLDTAGRPARHLTTADFDVRVDGKPRRTLSADLIEFPPPSPSGAAPPAQAAYSSNEGFATGRSVLLIVDVGSFRPGEERRAVTATSGFLETLSPIDRIAVAAVPLQGTVLGFTTDHDLVRNTVERLGGHRMDHSSSLNIGIAESLRVARGDQQAWRQLVLRECAFQGGGPAMPGGQSGLCTEAGFEPECPCVVQHRMKSEVNAFARAIRYEAERQARGVLELLQAIREISGPKLVVLLSQGIFLDDLPFDRSALAVAASHADARVHVIQIEQGLGDAANRQRAQDQFQDAQLARNGLEDLAGMLGGRVYRALGPVEGQLQRIWSENASSWRLGVEPEPGDVDGRPHRLEVRIRQPGLAVYSRSHFIVEPTAHPRETPEDRLRAALRSPLPATALPVRMTHYTTYDRARGDVRVRIVAEMPATSGASAEPTVAFVVMGAKGEQVSAATREMGDKRPDARQQVRFAGEVAVPPGRYLVKLAALGADGRVGSVERRIDLPAPPPDGIVLGDIVVSELSGDPASPIEPVVLPAVTNHTLVTFVELFPPSGREASAADIVFEIAHGADRRVIASVPGSLRSARAGAAPSALAAMSLGTLPDGEYAARAVLTSGGTRIEGSWRAFQIVGQGDARR